MLDFYSDKQLRLLVEPLYASRPMGDRKFVVITQATVFSFDDKPALFADLVFGVDVFIPGDLCLTYPRAYLIREHGKPPDVVISIITDEDGADDSRRCASVVCGIPFFVEWDPRQCPEAAQLRLFTSTNRFCRSNDRAWFSQLGLGLVAWQGVFEGVKDVWLRWCDAQGQVIRTGLEMATFFTKPSQQKEALIDRLLNSET